MSVAEFFESMDYGEAPESDVDARAWIDKHKGRFGHFINGSFVEGEGSIASHEPATGNLLAALSQGNASDIDAAVKAARKAQTNWAGLPGHERAKHLYALARAVQRHARLFSVLEALDNGKPIRETRDIDIPLVTRHFYHHAGWAQIAQKEFPSYDPVGVVGQIIPWNFPLLMLSWKVAPALAFGNTVVLKPAEYTSLTALLFAEIAQGAGLPAGVFNVVTGDGKTGSMLVEHPDIDKIAFTGSTDVGRAIRKQTAGSGKSLTLELGGKSPFIVFDDADLDGAVEGVVDAIWFNQGQVCCAGSRLLLHEPIAEEFTRRLSKRMETLRVGSPLEKNIDIGAIVAPVQLERIKSLVEQGVNEGARLVQPVYDAPGDGSFFPPTLLCDVDTSSVVATEEIFGPVAVTMTFRTPEEAVQLANHSRYGLAASVWSENISLALELAAKLQSGIVWVNGTNLMDAACGFGGKKESGFGREGGHEGALEYLKYRLWSGSKPRPKQTAEGAPVVMTSPSADVIDRTAKLYIGGKQTRPDGGYSRAVLSMKGKRVGEVGVGNRKDIRNAVEAARKASGWSKTTSHNRAQVLYYLAENLAARSDEFVTRLQAVSGSRASAQKELATSIDRLFTYAAYADKFEGRVHEPPLRGIALAMNEPLGVVGVVCPPELPLLSMISLAAPLLSQGNRVVLIPSDANPLIATDFYQVLDTSDVPGGAFNIVTGDVLELGKVLAAHNDVDGVWAFGPAELSTSVEELSAGNLKRTVCDYGRLIDWYSDDAQGAYWLSKSSDVKNIWVPYGE
ncbi:MAG: aldehyde dehydrogenase family protein [Pseudomonadota bacterium]